MENEYIVYIGTYTEDTSEGIYGAYLNENTGAFQWIGLIASAKNPSYLTLDQSKENLYAVYETQEYESNSGGAVGSYKINQKNGNLMKTGEGFTKGMSPCHLCVNQKRTHLFTANYGDGSVSMFPIAEDGQIEDQIFYSKHEGAGPNKERQEQAHSHFVGFLFRTDELWVVDLGMDQIKRYQIDYQKNNLIEQQNEIIETRPGDGPRHIAKHPQADFFYLVNELSSSIMVFQMEKNGKVTNSQTIGTIPDSYVEDNICSGIKITPNGEYLYVANRGHNSITGYQINKETGMLTVISTVESYGKWPRDLEIDPSGRWLLVANQESDEIVQFEIQKEDGELVLKGVIASISKPVCIKIL